MKQLKLIKQFTSSIVAAAASTINRDLSNEMDPEELAAMGKGETGGDSDE